MADLFLSKKTMSSLEIAELTGKQHAHVMRDIRNLLEQGVSESNFGLSSYNQPQPNGGYKKVDCYELTRKGSLILASGYNALLREKIIDRWEALETGKAEPIISSVKTEANILRIGFKDQITWVKETKKLLSLDNHSTLGMLQKIADPLGLPLPEFVDEEAALPISELLEHKGIMNKKGKFMSGQEGNKRLLEAGLIEKVTRYSKSKGKDVPQWVITKKGEKYGKMHQYKDASSPSPIWFLKTSDELLSLMNVA